MKKRTKNSVAENKEFCENFIKYARAGGPKPHWKHDPSYKKYRDQIRKPGFRAIIEEIRPEWFQSPMPFSEKSRDALLEIAISGGPRPDMHSDLGRALRALTYGSVSERNQEWVGILREARPDWFGRDTRTKQRKFRLLQLAKSGAPGPDKKSSDWEFVKNTNNPRSDSYDKNFYRELERIRPDWFTSKLDDIVLNMKAALLEKARSNERRPRSNSKEWNFIRRRLLGEIEDSEFISELKMRAPHWFKPVKIGGGFDVERVDRRRKVILERALAGGSRPTGSDWDFIRSGCFSRVSPSRKAFYNKIREIRPDWFKRPKKSGGNITPLKGNRNEQKSFDSSHERQNRHHRDRRGTGS